MGEFAIHANQWRNLPHPERLQASGIPLQINNFLALQYLNGVLFSASFLEIRGLTARSESPRIQLETDS